MQSGLSGLKPPEGTVEATRPCQGLPASCVLDAEVGIEGIALKRNRE